MMFNKRLIAMVPEAKGLMIRKILASWLSLAAGIVMWFAVSDLLNRVLERRATASYIVMIFGVAACCIAARFLLTKVTSSVTQKIAANVKLRLRSAIYEKLRRLGSGYTDYFPTAELVQLSGDGVEQLESYFGNYLPQFVYAMLAPLTLLLVFLPLSPLTAVSLFLCVPLIPIAIMSVQKLAKRLLRKYWDAYAGLGDSFLENLQGLTTLKVYGADAARHEAMNREAEHFRKVTMKVLTMQLNSVTIMDLVAYGGTALGSILAARAFLLGQVPLGGAIAMIMLSSEFFLAMRALGSYFHVAMNGMAASDRMFTLFDIPEQEPGREAVKPGCIAARQLTFSYDGQRTALNELDFSVPEGSFVSVCGESGCGKSTLAALLSGKKQGYGGSLTLHGTELSDLQPESLRKLVTVVSCDSYVFSGTVCSCLMEGSRTASEKILWKVLDQVHLGDFLRSQEGLDTKLADRASNLSGGQRQRLALARALLKNSPIYIFDEATSNIDADSEEDIMAAIRSLKGTHTVLLISHRLSNVVESDEILFLDHGYLTERGTHASLMAQKGGYARMYAAQQRLEHLDRQEVPV